MANTNKDLNFNVIASGENPIAIELREGAAPLVWEASQLDITGNIDAPLRFIQTRLPRIKQLESHLLVSRKNASICFFENWEDKRRTSVQGSLKVAPEFEEMRIDDDKYYSAMDMADLFQKKSHYFESKDIAMKLVSELRNIKAKVDKEVENCEDKRGNYALVARQNVISNIPASFRINIPVIYGVPAVPFTVLVYIHPNTLEITLTSPEAEEMKDNIIKTYIDAQIDSIREAAPEVVIIEI